MLPVIPIGILWIIGVAATTGILVGFITFLITNEGTIAITVIAVIAVLILLIPYLPNKYKWVRSFKNKLRYQLSEDKNNDNQTKD